MNHTSFQRCHKKDAIHDDACRTLHDMGFSVYDSHKAGGGFGDAVVGACMITDILEFKTGNAPYTEAQVKLHKAWRGRPIVTLRSLAAVREWGLRELHERRRQPMPKALLAVESVAPGVHVVEPRCVHRKAGEPCSQTTI
jgi:hypothetical protein